MGGTALDNCLFFYISFLHIGSMFSSTIANQKESVKSVHTSMGTSLFGFPENNDIHQRSKFWCILTQRLLLDIVHTVLFKNLRNIWAWLIPKLGIKYAFLNCLQTLISSLSFSLSFSHPHTCKSYSNTFSSFEAMQGIWCKFKLKSHWLWQKEPRYTYLSIIRN